MLVTVQLPSVILSTVFASKLTCQEVRLESVNSNNKWSFSVRFNNCSSFKCNSNNFNGKCPTQDNRISNVLDTYGLDPMAFQCLQHSYC